MWKNCLDLSPHHQGQAPHGHVDECIRLVESYWNPGHPRHRILCRLGRKITGSAYRGAAASAERESRPKLKIQAEAVGAWDWGPMLAAPSLLARTGIASQHGCLGPQQWGSGRVRRPGFGAGRLHPQDLSTHGWQDHFLHFHCPLHAAIG